MADKLNEKLSGHQSELSYAGPGRSKKDLQRAYHKAHRASARSEIESQLAPMDVELPTRSIGDIVPIPREEWENYSGIPDDPTSGVPSEKEAYLFDLAYDVADGRVDMSSDDIVDLDAHTLDQFGWSFSYSVSGHGADLSAQDIRDEFYDSSNDPEYSEAAREVEKRLSEDSVREDHERELREAIRLIIQKKILPEAGYRRSSWGDVAHGRGWRDPGGQGVSAGQSYYSGKSIARQSALSASEKAKEILRQGGWEAKGWGLSHRGLEWTGPAASLMAISDLDLRSMFDSLSSIKKSIANSYGQRGPMRSVNPYGENSYVGFNVTMPGEENSYKFKWSGGKTYGEMWGPDIGSGMTRLDNFGETASGFLDHVKDHVANLSGAGDSVRSNQGDPDGDADDAAELRDIAADIEAGSLNESRLMKLAGLLKD